MIETSVLKPYMNYKGAEVLHTSNFDALPKEDKTKLEGQLAHIAANGFRRPITSGFTEDVKTHLRGGDLFIVMEGEEPVAFANRRYYPDLNAVYLAGAVKTPGKVPGAIEAVTRNYILSQDVKRVVTRTQNDKVVDTLTRLCFDVVPVSKKPAVEDIDLLAKMGLLTDLSSVDLRSLIVKGCYQEAMIASGERIRSRHKRVTEFTDQLDYFAGDAVLLVGRNPIHPSSSFLAGGWY